MKEAYYFSHDSNARNDERIINIRMKYGMEGYGIYFAIIERLRESDAYMGVKDYNNIAFDLRVDTSKIKSIIEDFGLFAFTEDGKCFYSESLIKRMKPFENQKKQRENAGKKSAEKRWGDKKVTTDKRPLQDTVTTVTEKSNKEKESKVNKKDVTNVTSKKEELDLSFVDVVYKPLFSRWLEYRKIIHKPFKSQAGVEGCYRQLLELSNRNIQTATKIVEQSIANEYQGLFALKKQNNESGINNKGQPATDDKLLANIQDGISRAIAENKRQ